ncbi:MAG: 2TM domain-containing protein [Bacteroidota bacterium]
MSRTRKKYNYEEKTLREKKIDFRRHFRTYLMMSVFFIALNLLTAGGTFWAIWPILGWGIAVGMQGLSLYGPLADPEDVHPKEEERDQEFSGPLPDLREQPEPIRRSGGEDRPYREEDLV